MLYFLLTIIAIGVLLASKEGKKLLTILVKFALFIGSIFLLILTGVFCYNAVLWIKNDIQTTDSTLIMITYIFVSLIVFVGVSGIVGWIISKIYYKYIEFISRKSQTNSRFWKFYKDWGLGIIFTIFLGGLGTIIGIVYLFYFLNS